MTSDLSGLTIFIAVAETLSFRQAGERLGLTRSAVSQAIRRLERRLGLALVERTTRSVRLTEAGEGLYADLRPALEGVDAAVRGAVEWGARPGGLLRLVVSTIAESFLSGPTLAGFLAQHPDIRLDLLVTDEEFDIVAKGFDAGVRLGEVIEQDMIAVPVSGDQRQFVVASPDYVAARGVPAHPRDLPGYDCIGWRPRPGEAPYRWEFTENGRDFDVAVDPRVTTNDMGQMVRLALAGAGYTFGMEETFAPHLERGDLVSVLDDFSAPFAGFHLFYPRRMPQPPKVRALSDYLRGRARRSGR